MSRYINTDIPFFKDDGTINSLGTVYFGLPNEDAKTNPKAPFLDEALTIPASTTQALTAGGKVQQKLYLDGGYSVITDDSDGVQIDEDLNAAILSSANISIDINGETRSLESYLENKEVADYTELRGLPTGQLADL